MRSVRYLPTFLSETRRKTTLRVGFQSASAPSLLHCAAGTMAVSIMAGADAERGFVPPLCCPVGNGSIQIQLHGTPVSIVLWYFPRLEGQTGGHGATVLCRFIHNAQVCVSTAVRLSRAVLGLGVSKQQTLRGTNYGSSDAYPACL